MTLPYTVSTPATPDATPALVPLLQPWTLTLSLPLQLDLLTALRPLDGQPPHHPSELLLRWYRRCVLLNPRDGRILTDPREAAGGTLLAPSLLGPDESAPWGDGMRAVRDHFVRELPAVPAGFVTAFARAALILGRHHPNLSIQLYWHGVYHTLARALGFHPRAAVTEPAGEDVTA